MVILKQLPYYTKQNLGLFLGKKGANLNYWLGKLRREKEIIQLKKGFYVSNKYIELLVQSPKESEFYLEYLSNIIREPSYVSLEYILAKSGLIPEGVFALTAITTKSSRKYTSEIASFIYRKIKPEFYGGYEFISFKDKKIKTATLWKALFDFLYFKRFTSVSEIREYLLKTGRFNWEVLSDSDKLQFIDFAEKSKSEKMITISRQIKRYVN